MSVQKTVFIVKWLDNNSWVNVAGKVGGIFLSRKWQPCIIVLGYRLWSCW